MKKPDHIEYHALHATLLTLCLAAMVFLSGCTSLDKAIQVATKTEANAAAAQQALNQKHEPIVSKNCATLYPVAESEVIPGKEQVTEEESETEPVTVPCEDAKGQPVKEVTCPGAKTVVRTVTRTDTIRVRDTAHERTLQLEALELQQKLTKETEAHTQTMQERDTYRKHRNTLLWIMGIGIVLFIGIKAVTGGMLRGL